MIRIGGKIIPWVRVRPWIRQPHSRRRVWDPIAELCSIKAVPDRIDAVAQDINSGEFVFADIDAWKLGELLGLDWEDAPADWSYTTLRAKMSVQDGGYDFPFAENLQLMESLIPAMKANKEMMEIGMLNLLNDGCEGNVEPQGKEILHPFLNGLSFGLGWDGLGSWFLIGGLGAEEAINDDHEFPGDGHARFFLAASLNYKVVKFAAQVTSLLPHRRAGTLHEGTAQVWVPLPGWSTLLLSACFPASRCHARPSRNVLLRRPSTHVHADFCKDRAGGDPLDSRGGHELVQFGFVGLQLMLKEILDLLDSPFKLFQTFEVHREQESRNFRQRCFEGRSKHVQLGLQGTMDETRQFLPHGTSFCQSIQNGQARHSTADVTEHCCKRNPLPGQQTLDLVVDPSLLVDELATASAQLSRFPKLRLGHKTWPNQVMPNKPRDPLGILSVRLVAAEVLHVQRIPHHEMNMSLQDGIDGNPIHASCLHTHRLTARGEEPIPQLRQSTQVRCKTSCLVVRATPRTRAHKAGYDLREMDIQPACHFEKNIQVHGTPLNEREECPGAVRMKIDTAIRAAPSRAQHFVIPLTARASLLNGDISATGIRPHLGHSSRNEPALLARTYQLHKRSRTDPRLSALVMTHRVTESVERYGELRELAENPPVGVTEVDLPLTEGEAALLEEQYAEAKAGDAWGVGLARTELVASDGTVLHFEVVIGDAGELEDPKGLYEFEQGEFLDTSEWIEVD